MDSLRRELRAYYQNLPELLSNPGRFVLIHGQTIAGVFETYADAMNAGRTKLGLDKTFLVRKISEH
jgi:hypothetical protein